MQIRLSITINSVNQFIWSNYSIFQIRSTISNYFNLYLTCTYICVGIIFGDSTILSFWWRCPKNTWQSYLFIPLLDKILSYQLIQLFVSKNIDKGFFQILNQHIAYSFVTNMIHLLWSYSWKRFVLCTVGCLFFSMQVWSIFLNAYNYSIYRFEWYFFLSLSECCVRWKTGFASEVWQ